MPTYEYACAKCSHRYEKREGFDAPAEQECPECGAKARRVLHAPPILFKGPGFYVTDSKSSNGAAVGAGRSVESVTEAKDEVKAAPASNGGSEKAPASSGNGSSKKD